MIDIEAEIVAQIEAYLPHATRLPEYRPGASRVLREAIVRDYIDDGYSMDKHIYSPFTREKGCQLHVNFNEADFRVEEYDMLGHLHTFAATAQPQEEFRSWTCACVYPLPFRKMERWKRENGEFVFDGYCNNTRGYYAWGIVYFGDLLQASSWIVPDLPAHDSLPHDATYERELQWHKDERTGKRELSDYMRGTQYPHDAREYARREKDGIPLTAFQVRVMAAGGWPYKTKENVDERPRVVAGDVDSDHRPADSTPDTPDPVGAVYPVIKPIRQYETLLTHCEKAKATQPESNAAHHQRWRTVMKHIRDGAFGRAKAYSSEYAGKGWKAWIDLHDMLKNRNDA